MAHNPSMKPCFRNSVPLLIAVAISVATGSAAPQNTNLLDEGEQMLREGRHADALAIYKKVLAESPDSYQANNQAGVALDLLGQYPEARKHFEKAIAVATDA